MNNIVNFNKSHDGERKGPYNLEYKINITKLHNLIRLRIIEISKNFTGRVEILNINLTNLENLFPNNNNDLTVKKFLTESINLTTHDLANAHSKIKKNYDIIFFQLPFGLKEPNENDILHKVIEKNLKKFGVALNVSILNSFTDRIDDKYQLSHRCREGILGNIYNNTSIDVSLYEFLKRENPKCEFNIYCCDYRNFLEEKITYNKIKIYKIERQNFFDAQSSIKQYEFINKNSNKNYSWLKNVSINHGKIDLTKSNKKKSVVIEKINNLKNTIYIPSMPSNTNKVETEVKHLKPWHYWMFVLDPSLLSNDFAKDFLNSKTGKEILMSLAVGSTIKQINSFGASRILILHKPLSEQKKILENSKKVKDFLNYTQDFINKITEEKIYDSNYQINFDNFLNKLPDYENKRLISLEESKIFERKETMRYDVKKNEIQNYIIDSVLKTIVAFLNTDGGHLIIGQKDNKEINGIESDKFKSQDDWIKFLKDKVKTHIGIEYFGNHIKYNFFSIEEKTVAIISCSPLSKDKNAFLNEQDFYVRVGPSSEKLSAKQVLDYKKNK
jgi:hypothetical protein